MDLVEHSPVLHQETVGTHHDIWGVTSSCTRYECIPILQGGYSLGPYSLKQQILDLGMHSFHSGLQSEGLQSGKPILSFGMPSLHWSLQPGGLQSRAYNLGQPILDVGSHSLQWSLQSGGLQYRATDFGSWYALTRPRRKQRTL